VESTPHTPYETMRYDPHLAHLGGDVPGLARLERHWARLERSASFTGVPLRRDDVLGALKAAVAGAERALRVRLGLSVDGEPTVETGPLDPPYPQGFADTPAEVLAYAGPGPFPPLTLAVERVDERNPSRRYKTSDRALYEYGRSFAPAHGLADVAFLNTRGELVEAAIATIYVGTEDEVLTPPLSSGALPGVLRAELLERGLVREAVLTEADLRSAPVVLISSSVRGLRRVSVTPGEVRITR
jgi:branched-subunit amino acid aminotransferase/4-amino-4-deoxychorismate lyase